MSVTDIFGASYRAVGEGTRDGAPTRIVRAERTYATDRTDLWNALTDPERIPRWFAPVSGDLREGGHYAITGNASGAITRCTPPEAFDLDWEFGGGVSWVRVRLTPEGEDTLLVLEHEAPTSGPGEEHWQTFGPAAVGVGWDLSFHGLGLHLTSGEAVAGDEGLTWMGSDEGKAFMSASAEGWRAAHVAAGEDPEVAAGMAARTAAFYRGETPPD